MGGNQGNGSALFTIRRRHPDTNFEKCSTFVKWLILVDILNSLIKGGSGRWGDIYAENFIHDMHFLLKPHCSIKDNIRTPSFPIVLLQAVLFRVPSTNKLLKATLCEI